MLFEAGRALFMKKHVLFMKKHVYLRKTSKVLTLNAVYAQRVSRKTVTKSLADSVVQFAILGAYTRRVNRKHFRFYWTKKHFISEWYFPKNHEIGSLVVRKVKNWWDSLAESWAWISLQQLLIFLSCLSSGWVKKLQKFVNLSLKFGHGANLKRSESTWRYLVILRQVQSITSKALGTMHA